MFLPCCYEKGKWWEWDKKGWLNSSWSDKQHLQHFKLRIVSLGVIGICVSCVSLLTGVSSSLRCVYGRYAWWEMVRWYQIIVQLSPGILSFFSALTTHYHCSVKTPRKYKIPLHNTFLTIYLVLTWMNEKAKIYPHQHLTLFTSSS